MKTFRQFAVDYTQKVVNAIQHVKCGQLYVALEEIETCRDSGGTVWLAGNGGSATLASHMATDLQLAGVRAIALTDVAAITTIANDQSYAATISTQVDRLSRPGDLLILISGSGTSQNLYDATATAQVSGIRVIGIFGSPHPTEFTPQPPVDVLITIPSDEMGVAQDGHQVVLHILTYYLMSQQY